MERIPVIAGPTAGGKSDLAVELAHALAARLPTPDGRPPTPEIITADAFQVFRGLDIGTAKPTVEERRGIPHHLIDVAGPGDRFSVADWLSLADRAVAEIRARGALPIVVGGTHLYIKAFLDGLFDGPAPDAELRASLQARPLAELRAELERIDPTAAQRIHPNDARRTIRALEVFHQTGRPTSEHQRQWDAGPGTTPAMKHGAAGILPATSRPPALLIGLDWPGELLNPRINARVKSMVDRGLVDEARALWASGAFATPAMSESASEIAGSIPAASPNQAREALGYKQLLSHFEGRCTLDEAVERIKIETRRFAKNQRTWLKRLRLTPGSVWIDAATTPREAWCAVILRALNKQRERERGLSAPPEPRA